MSDDRRLPDDVGHEHLDELAAAEALGALEPDEAAAFQAHLRHCQRCQVTVARFGEVAGRLSEDASDATPRPGLRDDLLAAARRTPQRPVTPQDAVEPACPGPLDGSGPARGDGGGPARVAPVVALPSRARRGTSRRVRLAAAAAAVVVVAGGAIGGVLATGGGLGPAPTSCTAASGCVQGTLASLRTDHPIARVVVRGGDVWVQPLRLAPDRKDRQIYVLWQIDGHHPPRAVGGFDVTGGERAALGVGTLVAPRRPDTSFAISLEPGRVVPQAPTDVVAVGHLD